MARRQTMIVIGLGATLLALGAAPVAAAPPPPAAEPAAEQWVVSVGDSYIAGEAGRWAGSSNDSFVYADALGPTAYFDDPSGTGELIEGCHRSKSAEIHLGRGVMGLNLACSGARTDTHTDDGDFKPGLDFADDGAGHLGQARMLQDFASTHDVDMVAVSIGGNDFEFGSIVQECVLGFLTSPEWFPDFCHDEDFVEQLMSAEHRSTVRADVAAGLRNIREAMRAAGHSDASWTLVVQTYPSPIPDGSGFRYSQSGFTRQTVGGCGFWDEDADWANRTALPVINKTVRAAVRKSGVKGVEILDLAHAFDGRRLCERGVGLYEEVGLTSWTQPGAVDKTEWVNQIRTLTGLVPPYEVQESLHPNYWAQLATRSCLRKVYAGGDVDGGRCSIKGTGLVDGEPRMRLR